MISKKMKKPHIMFLDFDGPLFSGRALMLPENNEYAKKMLDDLKMNPLVSYWYADPVAIAMLIELYRYKSFKLVISNNWANPELHTKEQIINLLKKNGLGIPLHDNWRISLDKGERIEQIKEWLENNDYSDYIIIDDHESGESLSDHKLLMKTNINKEKIVLVNFDDGILLRDFYKMQAIIANWN